jgi:hypothetical protein
MPKSLGNVLDYRGVSFNNALEHLRVNGVAFNSGEMNELQEFLLAFHFKQKEN